MIYVAVSKTKPRRAGIILTAQDVTPLRANHDIHEIRSLDHAKKMGLIEIPEHMINWETGKIMLPTVSKAIAQRVTMATGITFPF